WSTTHGYPPSGRSVARRVAPYDHRAIDAYRRLCGFPHHGYRVRVARRWDTAEAGRVRARLADLVAALPGTQTEDAHGHTGYLLRGKRFAWLLVDHHGDGRLA